MLVFNLPLGQPKLEIPCLYISIRLLLIYLQANFLLKSGKSRYICLAIYSGFFPGYTLFGLVPTLLLYFSSIFDNHLFLFLLWLLPKTAINTWQ